VLWPSWLLAAPPPRRARRRHRARHRRHRRPARGRGLSQCARLRLRRGGLRRGAAGPRPAPSVRRAVPLVRVEYGHVHALLGREEALPVSSVEGWGEGQPEAPGSEPAPALTPAISLRCRRRGLLIAFYDNAHLP